ncbi:hypothetical protein E2C01_040915 [Portunus trituberculatus]|uniref:Uncharacterized protein n=1 Tax=Portunus trituberculatus TaxID=210409 RepID=A0A5B7FQI1_PORTR|nr:hypothetical protein [Portunus trituberculatus]
MVVSSQRTPLLLSEQHTCGTLCPIPPSRQTQAERERERRRTAERRATPYLPPGTPPVTPPHPVPKLSHLKFPHGSSSRDRVDR